jgi:hypothetical protein
MLNRMCRACRSGEGEVVEILEDVGMRRAKVLAGGALVEVATLGGGELHLGDRIALELQPALSFLDTVGAIELDDLLDLTDDTDRFSLW